MGTPRVGFDDGCGRLNLGPVPSTLLEVAGPLPLAACICARANGLLGFF